ncbi:MAG: hypothetical protein ACXAEX_17320 [Promethearchaeota archaeon]|jgi:ribosomal protein L40E
MDITKFNSELQAKVATAKSYEKRNEIDRAIKLWVEISEMALKFSKSRNIDASFKNMLLNRTKGIIEHIKNLKAGQIEKVLFDEEVVVLEEDFEDPPELVKEEKLSTIEPQINKLPQRKKEVNANVEIVEDSEFRNLPKGFKEIKTSEDFQIITPHDENFIEKHLGQEKGSLPERGSQPNQEKADFQQPEDKGFLICFACGYENEKEAKLCRSCGTKLN